MRLRLDCHAQTGAARVTNRHGEIFSYCRENHLPQFVFVLRRKDIHLRDCSQVRQIECAVMCCAVLADQPRPVQTKQHRQILQADVVENLVVAALQES